MCPCKGLSDLMICFSSILFVLVNFSQAIPVDEHVHRQRPGSRIIGGDVAVPYSAPYTVAMWTEYVWYRQFCGGSIISPNYVLTAGHCVYGADGNEILFGVHNISDPDDPHLVRVINASMYLHEDFDPYNLHNDLALIKLSEPLIFNDYIKAVKLPSKKSIDEKYLNQIARAYGRGITHDYPPTPVKSEVLRYVDVPVIDNSICKKEFSDVDTDKHICTSNDGVKSPCHGDSGGPLMLNGIEIGMTSFGNTTHCEKGKTAVYINLAKYLDWIEDHSDVVIDDN